MDEAEAQEPLLLVQVSPLTSRMPVSQFWNSVSAGAHRSSLLVQFTPSVAL